MDEITCSQHYDKNSGSALLMLPREVRDLILADLLVHDDGIGLACVAVPHPDRAHATTVEREMWTQYPLKCLFKRRSTWHLQTHEPSRNKSLRSTHARATYEMSVPSVRSLQLRVMRVCKQLYVEAREIFYSKNTFRFIDDFRVPTACSFLEDRPPESLSCIRSLDVGFLEVDRTLTDLHGGLQSLIPHDDKELYIEYSCDRFERLCAIIASPRMQLKRLGLCIETHADSSHIRGYMTVEEYLNRHSLFPYAHTLPSWLEQVFCITDLDEVTLSMTSWAPFIHRQALIADAVKKRMLKLKPAATAASGSPADVLELRMHLNHFAIASFLPRRPWGIDAKVMYDTDTRQFEIQETQWRMDGLRLVEVSDNDRDREGNLNHLATLDYSCNDLCVCVLRSSPEA